MNLLINGFSIYAWQAGQIEELNKDNMVQSLKEPQVLERIASPAEPQEIERVVIDQLPNVVKDNMLILDDYQINGLLHPAVFDSPRALDVSEVVKYQHDRKRLIAALGKQNSPIVIISDTDVSKESEPVFEELQKNLPELAMNSQFRSAFLDDQSIQTLLDKKEVKIAGRMLRLDQLPLLEEVTLSGLSADSLLQIIPHLTAVKKLKLVNFKQPLNLSDKEAISRPNLEKVKLVGSTINTTDLVALIKNAPRFRKLSVCGSRVNDNGAFTAIASKCFNTIKLKNGVFSKNNYQQVLINNKINRFLFKGNTIISDTLTEIKDRDFSSIKIAEIEGSTCDAEYLNQMFTLLPQLEHLKLRGGTIKPFKGTFSLKYLKKMEIDLQRFNELAGSFDNMEIEELILIDKNSSDVAQLSKINLARMSYFRISNNNLNPQFLDDVLKRATRLNHLDLQGCTNLNFIADKIPLTNLDTLNLSKTDITAASLERILEKMPKLQRLDLTGCSQLTLTPKLRSLLEPQASVLSGLC